MSAVKDTSKCELPQVTFSTFIISLASAVLVGLGEVPDPANGQVSRDLLMARHNIDVLDMLREKTSGGLEKEEAILLDSLLCELRLKYVIISQGGQPSSGC